MNAIGRAFQSGCQEISYAGYCFSKLTSQAQLWNGLPIHLLRCTSVFYELDNVGHLQHRSLPHLAQSGTDQEAGGLSGVHYRARNDAPAGASSQRAFHSVYESLYAIMAAL